jgi:3-oxoacyl-[acyl-carrier protein] reductase
MFSDLPPLRGRNALVTGASRGIGAAIATALAAEGAHVVITGRDARALEAVARKIESSHGSVSAVCADLTDSAQVLRLRQHADERFGTVELVAHCAGGGGNPISFLNESTDAWRHSWEANLLTTVHVIQAFLPAMIASRRGAIITLSSTAGRQVSGSSSSYAAAKSAVLSATRQAALEAAPHGVRINALAPSAIVTDRLGAVPESTRDQMAQGFPLRRLGTTDDVTRSALFLLSDASSWITGVTLDVAGGRIML